MNNVERSLIRAAAFRAMRRAPLWVAILILVAGWAMEHGFGQPSMISGIPRVIDGDTLAIGPVHIRLQGLDAEELSDPHGPAAAVAMQEIVGIGSPVRCEPDGTMSYRRVVATCFNVRGEDIARVLVARGAALDCRHYSRGRYASAEKPGARSVLKQASYCDLP